jgi:hypothetical protein
MVVQAGSPEGDVGIGVSQSVMHPAVDFLASD